MNFWETLVDLGWIEGDPAYYTGSPADADVLNALTVADTAAQSAGEDSIYHWMVKSGFIEGDPAYYATGQASESELLHAAGVAGATTPPASAAATVGASPGVSVPTDEDSGPSVLTADEEYPGLMAGGTVTAIARPGLDDTYAYTFEYPEGSGQYVAWEFDSLDQIEQTVGADWWKTIPYKEVSSTAYQADYTVVADIGGLVGQSGDFYAMMAEAAMEGAVAGGAKDPTLVGKIMQDPEMQHIMALDTFGDLTDEEVMALKRDTNFWKNELYPGIENLYDRTTNPEQAWAEYAASVEGGLVALGVERDVDGTFNSQIASLLSAGVEDEEFVSMVPTMVRAQSNLEFAGSLSQWSQAMLGEELTFDNWFDIMAGNTPAELEEVVEAAGLQYQLDQQGIQSVSAAQIEYLTSQGDLTEEQAARAFSEYSGIVTSLAGAIGPNVKYDLTTDDVLSLATGIKPASGRSIEEIRVKSAQAARELGALDDQKIQFFVGYDAQRGTPNRPGLNPLAPEGA